MTEVAPESGIKGDNILLCFRDNSPNDAPFEPYHMHLVKHNIKISILVLTAKNYEY